ncbi:hypothetical protein Ancab_037058 [Ancistrocladus abbreviatus]
MENQDTEEIHNCVVKMRVNSQRQRDKVYIGCGAGFGGDRPVAALKLLQRVKELNYLVLECLAERTLVERYQAMVSGADGYDSRISEWMQLLLPLAVERGACIITNMGAMDPIGAQEKVLEIAGRLRLFITVSVAHEVAFTSSGLGSLPQRSYIMEGGISTYLGAAPIVKCLELYKPNVIITSRVADAALFLGPMVYELGWNWDDLDLLAQGSLAGHLLECGCQLTGGYFMHPGDRHRYMSFSQLLDVSLPFVEVSYDGEVIVGKVDATGGVLNFSTCAEQLLYEVGDPSAYVTPDVVLDVRNVTFKSLSSSKVLCAGAKPSAGSPDKLLKLVPKECGWKGWGEISYGGYECVARARAAEYLVRSWMEELYPGINGCIISYIIGVDSLKVVGSHNGTPMTGCGDVRLRMDGLFELKEHAVQFAKEFTALYTNGPAGGGGISTGHKREVVLEKQLVGRDCIFWRTGVKSTNNESSRNQEYGLDEVPMQRIVFDKPILPPVGDDWMPNSNQNQLSCENALAPVPSGQKTTLHEVAHSRAGDKGNDLNFSIIPHFPADIERLKLIITPEWVKEVLSPLLNPCSFPDSDAIDKRNEWVEENVKVEIYEVKGIHSLNVVVCNILDGGVNCSRRIDRHGKTLSDIILCQEVVLP